MKPESVDDVSLEKLAEKLIERLNEIGEAGGSEEDWKCAILSVLSEAKPEIEDQFVNRMAAVFKKSGLDWSDCDGDDDAAEVIANYFTNRIQALERKKGELEAQQEFQRRKILTPASCKVSGHFKFQENGGNCLMCEREWRILSEATAHVRSVSQAWFEKYQDARNLWNVAPEDSHQGWIMQMQDCIDKVVPTAALEEKVKELEAEIKDGWMESNQVGTRIIRDLEEKIKQLERDLDWTRDNATEHCRRADTAEAAVGENCRRIEELELADATALAPQPSSEVKEPAWRPKFLIIQESSTHALECRVNQLSDYEPSGPLVTDTRTIDVPPNNMNASGPEGLKWRKRDITTYSQPMRLIEGVEKVGDKQPRTMAEQKD